MNEDEYLTSPIYKFSNETGIRLEKSMNEDKYLTIGGLKKSRTKPKKLSKTKPKKPSKTKPKKLSKTKPKKSPKLHTGPRGGKYIIKKGKKIYQ